jgi:hypothetical protein
MLGCGGISPDQRWENCKVSSILIPSSKNWTTFTSTEQEPDCGYLGGMAVCAEVALETPEQVGVSNPIWMVYGWNGAVYNYDIARVEGVSIYQTCYDAEKVENAVSAQQAIDDANEYQGGEADWISDTAQLITSSLSGIVESGIIKGVTLDDHEAAQKFLIERVKLQWK